MTRESRLETLWRSYNAFAARDADALVAAWHPDGEWLMGPGAAAVGDERFRGHDRLREFVRRLADDFSVIEAAFPYGQVVEYRDGLILRVTQTDDPPPGWDDASPLHS